MPFVTRDGRPLFYREEGSGGPPILLVHGWCCDHTYMAPQIEHLASAHRVIAPDLSGHGRSDASPQVYTMGGFADELAWLARHLALDRPVVIGHSMGGGIALELSARHPDVPAAIAMLDSTIVVSAERRARMEALLPLFRAPGYRDAMRDALEAGFFQPWDNPERRARIVEAMTAAPQHVVAGAWQGILEWNGAAATAACKVPALYVASSAPRTDLARMRQLCPQLLTAQIVGAGHFVQLEVPEQVNAMLDRFQMLAQARPGR
jgi:pimeloyl-ACP methyl ester carboxylesterase